MVKPIALLQASRKSESDWVGRCSERERSKLPHSTEFFSPSMKKNGELGEYFQRVKSGEEFGHLA